MMQKSIFTAALLAFAFTSQTAHAAVARHSMSEYAYLIGSWKCVANVPGRKPVTYETSFRWMYPSKTVVDQMFRTKRGDADFMLSYQKATDSFVGVFTDSGGGEGFWRNPGPVDGGWTEYGWDISDLNNPNTRATFYGITPTHYAFHFYAIKGKSDLGKTIEDDACDKL